MFCFNKIKFTLFSPKNQTFISSAAVEHLDFLNRLPDSNIFTPFEEKTMKASFKSLTEIPQLVALEEEAFASEAVRRDV